MTSLGTPSIEDIKQQYENVGLAFPSERTSRKKLLQIFVEHVFQIDASTLRLSDLVAYYSEFLAGDELPMPDKSPSLERHTGYYKK